MVSAKKPSKSPGRRGRPPVADAPSKRLTPAAMKKWGANLLTKTRIAERAGMTYRALISYLEAHPELNAAYWEGRHASEDKLFSIIVKELNNKSKNGLGFNGAMTVGKSFFGWDSLAHERHLEATATVPKDTLAAFELVAAAELKRIRTKQLQGHPLSPTDIQNMQAIVNAQVAANADARADLKGGTSPAAAAGKAQDNEHPSDPNP